jgi:hypothetical protein
MKNTILFSFIGILVGIAMIAFWNRGVDATKQSESYSILTLKVSTDKQTYMLGEAVELNFELINEGNEPVKLPYRPDVSTGYLSVWIASDGHEFSLYNNTSWGRMESGGMILQPNESFKSQATVLWNSKPQIPRSGKGKILTDYAFTQSGVYLIKSIVNIPNKTLTDSLTKIESKPIQIVVNEPIGDDLKVWNKIKDNGEVAYFLQHGSFLTSNNEKIKTSMMISEEIAAKYQNSLHGKRIQEKMVEYRQKEAEFQEFKRKHKLN